MATTKLFSARISPVALAAFDEIKDALGTSRADAIEISAILARDALGLSKRAPSVVIAELERDHGDARLRVEIEDPGPPSARVTIAGAELEGFSARATAAIAMWTSGQDTPPSWGPAGIYVRHDETGVTFHLGVIEEPVAGEAIDVAIADLPSLVVCRQTDTKSPDELFREIRFEVELRRKARELRGREDPDDE
jgi:hypothetical protein